MSHPFQHISVKNLVSRCNVCAPDWGEVDCVYGYHKLYYFLEGEGTLILDGDTFTPEPEELFLIPADMPHTYFHNPERPVVKYWSHFNLSFLQGQKLVYHKETVKCSVPQQQIVPLFSTLMETELSTNPLDILAEKAALLGILSIFLKQVDLNKIFPPNSDDFTNIMDGYIKKHIKSAISLSDLAGVVHLHPNYFVKVFKKHFSVTPIEYVNAIRLQTALRTLTYETDRSIQSIADEAGFNDYRYFSRLFKKKYGVSPTQYRGQAVGISRGKWGIL